MANNAAPLTYDQFNALMRRITTTRGADRIKRLAVPVEVAHATIGATPSVAITNVSMGFDWDNGVLMLTPEQPLTPLSPAELEEIRQCRSDGQSWAVYKALERWQIERDELVDNIIKLRTALLQRGMSTDELIELAGDAPAPRARRRKL
jgi:hypothetical protein